MEWRCNKTTIDSDGEMHVCTKDEGHAGAHRDANGVTWIDTPKPKTYWQEQLDRITLSTRGHTIKVRFDSPTDRTNYLSLTPEQFEQVKGFLLSIEEGLI